MERPFPVSLQFFQLWVVAAAGPGVPSAEGEAADSGPGTPRPAARSCARPPASPRARRLLRSARPPPPPRPSERPRCRPPGVWWWRRVSARAGPGVGPGAGAGGRAGAALAGGPGNLPGQGRGARREPPPSSGSRRRGPGSARALFSVGREGIGDGGGGKVNSTLPLSPGPLTARQNRLSRHPPSFACRLGGFRELPLL